MGFCGVFYSGEFQRGYDGIALSRRDNSMTGTTRTIGGEVGKEFGYITAWVTGCMDGRFSTPPARVA